RLPSCFRVFSPFSAFGTRPLWYIFRFSFPMLYDTLEQAMFLSQRRSAMSTDCPQPTRPVSARRRRVARRRQAGCLLFLLILIALAVFVVRLVFFSGNGEADAPHTAENE